MQKHEVAAWRSVPCWVRIIQPWHHALHISELKYAPTHGTFPSCLEFGKPTDLINGGRSVSNVEMSLVTRLSFTCELVHDVVFIVFMIIVLDK